MGDVGPQVVKIQHRLLAAYPKNSQAKTLGVVESGRYDEATQTAVKNIQPFLNLPATGIANAATQRALGVVDTPAPAPVFPHRKIWFFSAPGSGADWNVGPSFEVGEMVTGNRPGDPNRESLHINHQPLSFLKGGYMGLLGGSATATYVEVTWDECMSLLHCLDVNPDVQEALNLALEYCTQKGWKPADLTDAQIEEIGDHLELELWMSGYSQSADGLEDALEHLFGDGGFVHPGNPAKVPSGPGKYRILRGCINGVPQFGNPSKPVTGIARKVRPDWLARRVHCITNTGDFYAEVPASDHIRPAFYAIIIQSAISLPFMVHVLRIAVPIVMKWAATLMPVFGPLLGGFGPMVQMALGGLQGLQGLGNTPAFAGLMGQAAQPGDEKVDHDLEQILEPQGLLQNIPSLIQLIAAVGPGLDAHNTYHLPKPEHDGRSGIQVAYDIVAAFRR
nr:peptidoglycan-binding domain-containing protein [Mycolicibacterium sp. BK634]